MNQEKPIKVLMVCAMGMSSSLLESKTIEAARSAGVPFEMKSINTPEMARWATGTLQAEKHCRCGQTIRGNRPGYRSGSVWHG